MSLFSDPPLEMQELNTWLGQPLRANSQINKINESDCDLIKVDAQKILAVNTDSLSEELALGLYKDPKTIGKVAITSSLSDLAAVGAHPIGVSIAMNWAFDMGLEFKTEVQKAINTTLSSYGVPLLGGDTGSSKGTVLTVTSLGWVFGSPMLRKGIYPGDILFTTGPVGNGPALGLSFLNSKNAVKESSYNPRAQLYKGQQLKALGACAMDTSDGFMTSLDNLCRINSVSVDLDWESIPLSDEGRRFCNKFDLPLTSLLYAEHGDFELIGSIPSFKWEEAKSLIPGLNSIGRFKKNDSPPKIILKDKAVAFNTGFVCQTPQPTLEKMQMLFENLLMELKKLELP